MVKNKFLFLIFFFLLFLDLYPENLIKNHDIVFVLAPTKTNTQIRLVDGAKIVKLSIENNQAVLTELSSNFFSAMDPDISFDGKKILFAGKKSDEDSWQIWEMDIEGNNKKLLTSGIGNKFSPLHVGTLFNLNDKSPTKRIAFIKNTVNIYAIYSADSDGGNQTRITYNLSKLHDIDVFKNGRIIYNSMDQFGIGSKRNTDLLAVNIDGTDNMGYFTDNIISGEKSMVKVGFDRKVYFIENSTDEFPGGGSLSYILEKRPLHSYQNIFLEKDGYYHSPYPLQNGDLIISHRKNKKGTYALYNVDIKNRKLGKKIYEHEKFHIIDAQLISPRPRVRGRSTFVSYQQKTGVLYCISSYISQDKNIKKLSKGSIKNIKIFEGFYSDSSDRIITKLLGFAPVEKDGSFHIEVPAEKPLSFQLIDKNGKVIIEQDSWTWVMPRESRGCIGCHEDRELAPPNHLSDAIIKPAVKILNSIQNKNKKKGINKK